jgi:flagellar biosynthetic protein FlhB
MAEDENGQERTEQATPKRLREAREQGQVPRSRELNTTVVLLVGAGALLMMGTPLVSRLRGLATDALTLDRDFIFEPGATMEALGGALFDMLILLAPLMVILMIAALFGPMAVGGWNFSTKAITPSLSKLDPIKGLGKVFGWRGLMELAKALAKFLVVAIAAGLLIYYLAPRLLHVGDEPLVQGLAHAGQMIAWVFLILSATMILVAAVDVPFQLWQHAKQMKMTRQQVKDESKETEGRPEVKGKIRQLQREMAQRRMMEAVPKADVVVTNPTHFAVALKYDRKMNAPRVVAKGADLVAANIRGVAEQNKVPIFEAPPLARALYWSTEIDQEIPAQLYLAVAQVLAYVYQLKSAYQGGGLAPEVPTDLPVPEDMTHGPQGGRPAQ